MKKYLLHPTNFKLDGGAMFGIIPKPLWEKKVSSDELNRIEMSLRVVYLETTNHKILIDTGIGDYHSERFCDQFSITNSSSPLVSLLQEKIKVKPEQITDIIITHLHFDHVGGLGTGSHGQQMIFPKATVHLHQGHYQYAQKPTVRDQGSFHGKTFMPLLEQYKELGQLHLLTQDNGTILHDNNESIFYETSFGHTPYMIHPIFDQYIYMADLVPMGHHIRLPWVMGHDIEPGLTTVYKEKFYQKIIQNNLTMVFEHDLETWGGNLGINEKNQYCLKKEFKNNGKLTLEIP